MHFWPGKVERGFGGEDAGAEAKLTGLGAGHIDTTIGKGEVVCVFACRFRGEAELFDRCGKDDEGSGKHGVNLHSDGFAVDGEACGGDDGWATMSEGNERYIAAGAWACDLTGERLGECENAGWVVELEDAVFQGAVGEG